MKESNDFWIEVRNWDKFQHYKKEIRPAWLKLYANLNTDENWIQLSSSARGILIEIWLAAARTANHICTPIKILEKIAHCRMPLKVLKTLEKHGFIILHSRGTLESVYSDSRGTLSREDKRREDKKRVLESSAEPSVPIPSIQEIWNTNRGQLPEALKLTSRRQKAWSRVWKEKPDEVYWKTIVQKIATNEFCCGSKGWRATIDYVLKPDTHIQIMEGKYDGQQGGGDYHVSSGLQLR